MLPGLCGCRGWSFRFHLLRFHRWFLSKCLVSRRLPGYHQEGLFSPPILHAPLQRPIPTILVSAGVLRLQSVEQLSRRSPGFSFKSSAEVDGYEPKRIWGIPPCLSRWRFPPSSWSNFPILPRCPLTRQELFKRRLLDGKRNLRRVGNFYQPPLAGTDVAQQAHRIESLVLCLDLALYLLGRPRIGD